jgi:hypothetical protein
MKLKAVEVIQVLIVVKAIKEGKLDGNLVVEQFISTTVSHFVEGEPEVLGAIKEMVNDIDDGFLGGLLNKVLEKLAVSKPDLPAEQPNEDNKQSGDVEEVA